MLLPRTESREEPALCEVEDVASRGRVRQAVRIAVGFERVDLRGMADRVLEQQALPRVQGSGGPREREQSALAALDGIESLPSPVPARGYIDVVKIYQFSEN